MRYPFFIPIFLTILTGCSALPPSQGTPAQHASTQSDAPISIRKFVPNGVATNIPEVQALMRSRNDRRKGDLRDILTALQSYTLEHGGQLPDGIPTDRPKEICSTGAKKCGARISLDALVPVYLPAIPKDPLSDGKSAGTEYTIKQDSNGRLILAAPQAEMGETIEMME